MAKKFLESLKTLEKEPPLLRKDEQGRDVFFPWGSYGEAFMPSRKKIIFIKIALSFFLATFFILAVSRFISQSNPQAPTISSADIPLFFFITIMPSLYVGIMGFIARGSTFIPAKQPLTLWNKFRFFIPWLMFTVFQFFSLSIINTHLEDYAIRPYLAALNIICIIFTCCFFFQLLRRNGNFYSKKNAV